MEQTTRKPRWSDRVDEVLQTQRRSREWLAWMLDMDRAQLSHILRGDGRYRVSGVFKAKISKYLGVPYSWLFGDDDPAPGQAVSEPQGRSAGGVDTPVSV